MYNNIGGKIKDLAKGTFIVESIISVIMSFVMMIDTEGLSLLLIIVGPIIAWVSSWLLYGFGEIIDKLCEISEILNPAETNIEKTTDNDDDQSENVPQVVCPKCGKHHDFDYPKCPNCNYKYEFTE